MDGAVVIQYSDGREYGLDSDDAFDRVKVEGDKTHKDLGAKIVRYQADNSPYKARRTKSEDKTE